MDKEEALKIISMIVDGLDPYGAEDPYKNLPEDNPVTMRAVCMAIVSLLSEKDREDLKPKYKTKKYAELVETASGPLKGYLREKEKDTIFRALNDAEYKLKSAADILGLTLEEFESRIKSLGISHDITMRAILADTETDYFKELENFTIDKLLARIESNAIITALEKSNYNQNKAAEKLKISFRSLRYRIDKLHIDLKGEADTADLWVETDYFKYSTDLSLDQFLEKVEKKLIMMALKECNYNKTRTAENLGISFRALRYRIDHLGIQG